VGPIQRFPLGLLDLLSLKGIAPPNNLSETIVPFIDLLQMYGLSQMRSDSNTNAAAGEGVNVSVQLGSTWTLLYSASTTITKTATMTALTGVIQLFRGNWFPNLPATLNAVEFQRFGATDTGLVTIPWVAPYPLLCPPNTVVSGNAGVIGTDATAAVTVRAEFGLLA